MEDNKNENQQGLNQNSVNAQQNASEQVNENKQENQSQETSQGSTEAKTNEESTKQSNGGGVKTICIDFGGTICDDGKHGDSGEPGAMVPGADNATAVLKENGWRIVVWSLMDADKVREWLNKNGVKYDEVVTGAKPAAQIYLGEHMMTFRGHWDWTVSEIASFRPWTKNKESEKKDMEKSYKQCASLFDEAKMVM